jgi:hypothetical protein
VRHDRWAESTGYHAIDHDGQVIGKFDTPVDAAVHYAKRVLNAEQAATAKCGIWQRKAKANWYPLPLAKRGGLSNTRLLDAKYETEHAPDATRPKLKRDFDCGERAYLYSQSRDSDAFDADYTYSYLHRRLN